jgi:hypothetical protein
MKALSLFAFAFAGLLAASPLRAEAVVSEAEAAAIKAPALDYIEGWYEGDAARMERALYPDLAKRIPRVDQQTGRTHVEHMGALLLVQYTRAAYGTKTSPERRQKDLTILDVYENIATVKLVAADFVDYLQLAKVDGRWIIVNVLWTFKAEKKT